jgi:hypothetical protein
VVAGDLLLDVTQEFLKREKLTASGVAFLFDDEDRILAHPRMTEMLGREVSGTIPRLRETDMAGVLKAIRAWRANGIAEQFFRDPDGRLYAAAFQTIPSLARPICAWRWWRPVDESLAAIPLRAWTAVCTSRWVSSRLMVPIVISDRSRCCPRRCGRSPRRRIEFRGSTPSIARRRCVRSSVRSMNSAVRYRPCAPSRDHSRTFVPRRAGGER